MRPVDMRFDPSPAPDPAFDAWAASERERLLGLAAANAARVQGLQLNDVPPARIPRVPGMHGSLGMGEVKPVKVPRIHPLPNIADALRDRSHVGEVPFVPPIARQPY